jgi:hypothetical protein
MDVMTSRRIRQRRVMRWLEAERAGRVDEADQDFRLAIRSLPRLAPSSGFAGRVLLAAGVVQAAPGLFSRWWFRSVLVSSLVLASAAALALPIGPLLVGAPSYVASSISLLTGVLLSAGELMRRALAISAFAAQIAGALQLALRTPPALTALFISAVVAAASLYGLRRLLVSPEELVEC